MIAQGTIQLNMRLPEAMISEIDNAVSINHYRNRQEFVRTAIREFLRTNGSVSIK